MVCVPNQKKQDDKGCQPRRKQQGQRIPALAGKPVHQRHGRGGRQPQHQVKPCGQVAEQPGDV